MAGIGSYKPVKLVEYTVSKDVNGDNQEAVNKYRCWAEVEDLGGSRGFDSGVTTSQKKRFKVRFRSNWILSGDWKVEYYGRVYTINHIERIKEKRFNWSFTTSD